MIVRLAEMGDAAALFDHCLRHFRESGSTGDQIFHPIQDFEEWKREDHIGELLGEWTRALHEPRWRRTWIVEKGGEILGDCALVGQNIPAALHRCQLGIGLERAARAQGIGRQLLQTAVSWAKLQPSLHWIDLYVFAHNEGAISLYETVGFQKGALVRERFRVQGQTIDDWHMTLQLR